MTFKFINDDGVSLFILVCYIMIFKSFLTHSNQFCNGCVKHDFCCLKQICENDNLSLSKLYFLSA